jgi:hypothetical protein
MEGEMLDADGVEAVARMSGWCDLEPSDCKLGRGGPPTSDPNAVPEGTVRRGSDGRLYFTMPNI